jgi:hypothetical protein
VEHLESQGLLNINQHGFRKGRSCSTQLLEVMESWTKIFDDGHPWDCIYMDYAKAFDSVPHIRLIEKIKAHGIKGKLLIWITNFLNNRRQRVQIENSFSSWLPVTSGIPQGSVLGPILFLLFINDLPDLVNSEVKLFADDTKIFRKIESDLDICLLQEDINNLLKWSATWQLPFNIDKCKVLHFNKNNPKNNYKMTDKQLETSNSEKDLGVTFSDNFNFKMHITSMISKANSRVGIIKRTFSNMNKQIFLPIYKSLVRPILEYCSSIWFPIHKNEINEIEKIQKRATKLVYEIKNKSYSERLKYLQLDTLHFRRLRNDIIQTFRIIKGIDKVSISDFFTLNNHSITRGHSLKISKPRASTSTRLNSFSNRVVNTWNNLKEETIQCQTLNSFKTALHKEWSNHPLRYDISTL